MGFYGNITNVANTTFQFDKIYSNRVEMESHCNSDGIMVGRYVLVEYDNDAAYPVIYTNNGKFYSSPGYEEVTRIKFLDNTDEHDGFHLNEIGQVQVNTSNEQGIIISTSIEFYRCTGQNGDYAVFKKIDEPNTSNYIANFSIDEAQYSNGKSFRGYDSTVWVKTSDNNGNSITTHYVNIADLNSVVPTFDITTDAPTMSPITPHFDADSTNVYYKLHMQQPFGFRIKEASDSSQSDEKTTHYSYSYDEKKNIHITDTKADLNADIYYNAAAFEPQVITKDNEQWKANRTDIQKHSTKITDNEIMIEPTGESGNKYSHTTDVGDIQEFSLHLPAVGNMMSDAWDIIHGPNRDDAQTDENSSLQGRLDSFANMNDNQIPVKRDDDGTFVGTTINGATPWETTAIEDAKIIADDFSTDDAWIKTTINTSNLANGSKEAEKNNNGISIHHTWHKGTDTESDIDMNKVKDTFDIVTPIVDQAGHVVAHNTETITLPYGYKTVNIAGQSAATSNPTVNTTPVVADNSKDQFTLASSNKWVRLSATDGDTNQINIGHEVHTINETKKTDTDLNNGTDTITVQDTIFDAAGHVTSNQNHTYTLPFGFKTVTVNNNSNADTPATDVSKNVVADNTQDTLTISASNDWVRFSTDANADEIKVGHKLSSLGKGTYASTDTAISEFGDSFNVVNFTTDEAGHVVGASTTTITTPVGHYNTDTTTNNTTVLTGFEYTPAKGDIKTYSEQIDTLKFTDFSAASGKLAIDKNSTLANAFKTVQEYINGLDQTTSGTTTFISGITQTDGQLAFTRSEAGTLQIGTASNDGTVKADSSIIGAINLLEARIKKEEKARADAINTLYGEGDIAETFDTIKEIADWLDGAEEGSSVEQLVASINNNATKISDEITRATNAETAIKNTINGLTVVDTAVTDKYVSAVSQSGGKITVTRATLPIPTITTGTANGTISVNGSDVSVKGLGSAAYTASTAYATAAQGTKADNAVDKTTYEIKIAELEATINALTARIDALETTTE